MTRQKNAWIIALAAGIALLLARWPAEAHPHVWVTMETTVLYDGGRVTGFRHKWAFDDAYTAMAIEGLDKNGDGVYSREELADLAKVNIEGLQEFSYFTHARLGKTELKLKDPVDYYLEHKDGVLSLYFSLPLEQPVLADAEGLTFSVYDETFFIAFDFQKENPVKLGQGAPPGCAATFEDPSKDLEALQSLNQTLGGQATAGNANMGMGSGFAQTVTIACKKS